ncbi:SMEK domain-containing protein [Lysinibacillus mangiferihumi]|uniref:SMEK domain-containing protein n=1 Tax=Lysinibacillus mangiferihumi TaxID=1130819 RepID=UPI0012904157
MEYTDLNNKIGYTDINKSTEDFYAGLLSLIYEINLLNMNETKVNHPAINLGDIESQICYQVTSTSERAKIQRIKKR